MIKVILVALTTTREIDGRVRKVRFKAGSTVDLTEEEIDLFDRLERSTGKLHMRSPVNETISASIEAALAAGSGPELLPEKAFAGQDIPVTKKTAAQLKAFIEHHGEAPDGTAKSALLTQAQAIEARLVAGEEFEPVDEDNEDDLDGGL